MKSRKLSTFASALLAAVFALPVTMCAQAAPTTTTPAKKPAPAPTKAAVVQPKVVVPPVKQPVTPPKVATPPAQPSTPVKTATTPVQPVTPSVTTTVPVQPGVVSSSSTTAVQPSPVTPAANTQKPPATNIAQPAPARATIPATTARSSSGTPVAASPAGNGTLTWGTVVYSPTGCVHNGTKAVCTFTLVNQGNAVTLLAGYQMTVLQFVDDAHVPHAADSVYFVDNYGTRQGQLFVNGGDSGTLIKEFPNVDARVAGGEFHLADQIVGGINVGAPGTLPTQAPAVANTAVTPQPAVQPTTTTDPTNQVQQSINQVNDKKQKAKSLWDQIKTIKK